MQAAIMPGMGTTADDRHTPREAALLVRLGAEVRRRRMALGLSEEKFAERSGHHRTFVGAVERGQMNVSVTGLDRIAEALGCRLVDLVAAADRDATGSIRR